MVNKQINGKKVENEREREREREKRQRDKRGEMRQEGREKTNFNTCYLKPRTIGTKRNATIVCRTKHRRVTE